VKNSERRVYWLLLVCLLMLAAVITLACGSGQEAHTLQTLTVSPATADAQQSGGEVQFTATGVFSTTPSPVTPLPASWAVCSQNVPTPAASITSDGLAHCAAGASGTFAVVASDYPNQSGACPANLGCGAGCVVSGSAQLTCP
jgi:hypothetical protein